MISVILPTYERVDAVLCSLAGLKSQTLHSTMFDVILIDDSDTDAVRDTVYEQGSRLIEYSPYITYIRVSPPRVGRFTASRARNVGAANARGDLLVFIDQDVILSPDCLERYAQAYERHGDNVVYVGLYHWMRRIDFDHTHVAEHFDEIVQAGLGHIESERFPALAMGEPGLQGIDHRFDDFGDLDYIVDDAALGAHSGNISYPRKLYMELGGFDEAIIRHGGEDADLGLTAKEHGAKFLLWREIWGVHRWHDRNQKQNAEDVQFNIDYIDRKHGIGQYADAKKYNGMDARDWSDPRHFHKDVGGVLMQADNGDSTIWVCRERHRLGLPTPEWIKRLGFRSNDVLMVPPSALGEYAIEGTLQ